MAHERNRFPWWLVACAAILMPLAAVVGLIETVGRQGTLAGRFHLIQQGLREDECLAILGQRPRTSISLQSGHVCVWQDGPNQARIWFRR